MKNFTLLLIVLASFNANAQRFKEICMWEVTTEAGGIVFGISETEEEANLIMQDFQKRNTGTKNTIIAAVPTYKYTTVNVANHSDNPVEGFKAAAGKSHTFLSAEDHENMSLD